MCNTETFRYMVISPSHMHDTFTKPQRADHMFRDALIHAHHYMQT